MFIIFTDKRGISSVELAEELKVNYKTACLLQSKCRILMRSSNSRKSLDAGFYESDIAYICAPSEGKRGMSTEKQAYLIVLSSGKENQYPEFIKIKEVDTDSGKNILDLFTNFVKMDKNRLLNTDGKTTYNVLKPYINVKNEKIDYEDENHRLWFLNKIISNLRQMILGVYHGIDKRMLPLYFSEYEWRFNHRRTKDIMSKIKSYIQKSFVMTQKMIKQTMNQYAIKRGLA